MGVQDASSCLYSVDKVSPDELATVVRRRAAANILANQQEKRNPVVCLDVNWLACKYSGRSGGPYPVVMKLAKVFIERRIDVLAVVDGPIRHHSKKASIQRRVTGGQFVLQPNFAESDKKFSANSTLRSASLAADRSGNERAVKMCKNSNYIRRGLSQFAQMEEFCDVWLAWSFQVNFMYAPVH